MGGRRSWVDGMRRRDEGIRMGREGKGYHRVANANGVWTNEAMKRNENQRRPTCCMRTHARTPRLHSAPSLSPHLHFHPPSHCIPPALAACPIVSPHNPRSLPAIVSHPIALHLLSMLPRHVHRNHTPPTLRPDDEKMTKRRKTGAQEEMPDSPSACVCICTPALPNQTKA